MYGLCVIIMFCLFFCPVNTLVYVRNTIKSTKNSSRCLHSVLLYRSYSNYFMEIFSVWHNSYKILFWYLNFNWEGNSWNWTMRSVNCDDTISWQVYSLDGWVNKMFHNPKVWRQTIHVSTIPKPVLFCWRLIWRRLYSK